MTLLPISGLPAIRPGDDLGRMLFELFRFEPGDVLVVASTVVSKAEGRRVVLAEVEISERAQVLADELDKDPALVELALRESSQISRAATGVLIVRHHLGLVSANAAIDRSNTGVEGTALLLPQDPDASARGLAEQLGVAVVISDSLGRPFRRGTVGAAIGLAGVPALDDRRGQADLDGRTLEHTLVATADAIAAAADLVMGQGDEGVPAVVVRGLDLDWDSEASARDLCREPDQDLYL